MYKNKIDVNEIYFIDLLKIYQSQPGKKSKNYKSAKKINNYNKNFPEIIFFNNFSRI